MMKNRIILLAFFGLIFTSCKVSRFQNFNKQKFLKGKLSQKFEDSETSKEDDQTVNYVPSEESEELEETTFAEEVNAEEISFSEYEPDLEEAQLEEEGSDVFRTFEEDNEHEDSDLEEVSPVEIVSDEEVTEHPSAVDFQDEMSRIFYTVICVLAVLCYFIIALVFNFILGPWTFLIALGLSIISILAAVLLHIYDFDVGDGILAWYLYTMANLGLILAFLITMIVKSVQ
jgi:hypothetical protein